MNKMAPIALPTEDTPVKLDRRMILGMAEAGLLDHLWNYELEDGVLVEMAASNSPHGVAVIYFGVLLVEHLPDTLKLASDTYLFLTEHDMRAPDIAVVPVDHDEDVFEPRDILLCVEIASESLAKDMKRKASEYARHAIPEYWVLDLPNRLLHIHREPSAKGYRSVVAQGWDVEISPLCAPGAALRPADRLDRVIK